MGAVELERPPAGLLRCHARERTRLIKAPGMPYSVHAVNADIWTMRYDRTDRHRVSSSPLFDYRPAGVGNHIGQTSGRSTTVSSRPGPTPTALIGAPDISSSART